MGAKSADITVVVTSCNRHDLLAHTLESFLAHETEHRIAQILVAEDGNADPAAVCSRFGAQHFRTGTRIGQVRLVDEAYARVTTPYIFHLEDDWEFYRPGFMEKSRALLEADHDILLVQLRPWNPDERLRAMAADGSHAIVASDATGIWHGFSFNPALRRRADYDLLGGFARQALTLDIVPRIPSAALPYEAQASEFYRRKGFYAAILDRAGYVRHIGETRHVADGANPVADGRDNPRH